MRLAELVMAVVLGLFSTYLMWKSAELPIGWIPDEGPGGGAFPFWLSTGMLLCCLTIIVRWVLRVSPLSRSVESYMDRRTLKVILLDAGSLTVMIGLIPIVGVYVSLPLFLFFYVRVLGGHSWLVAGGFATVAPVATFFFFEIALRITLPKGYTEPLFYPLYGLFL